MCVWCVCVCIYGYDLIIISMHNSSKFLRPIQMVDNRPDASAIKKQLETLRKSFAADGTPTSSSHDSDVTTMNRTSNSTSTSNINSSSSNSNKNLFRRAVSVGKLSLTNTFQLHRTSKKASADNPIQQQQIYLKSQDQSKVVPLPAHDLHPRSQSQTHHQHQQPQPPAPHFHHHHQQHLLHRATSYRMTEPAKTKFVVPKKATSKVVPRELRGPTPMSDSDGPSSPFIIRHF